MLVGAIFDVLYRPKEWADFTASTFYGFYQDLIQASRSNLAIASRSLAAPPEMKRESGQDWLDYTFQAITCGDSVDGDGTTTQAVFDEFTRVVKDVSPMCECPNSDRSSTILLISDVQSAAYSPTLLIIATDGPLVLSKGSLAHGTAR